uniref:BTB domain-containing protein n=1 Tax=Magallana gigas TaxID=29159 RepID=A0A8W8NCW5_MAGGI|nr:uncharacterized protein LOC105342684 isoform X4 [Crassostrea gigas]
MISYHKIYMSPVQSSNLQSQLCALWKKQKFCDAVIKSDNISVMAHRLVLSASCPVLQSIENYTCGSLLEIRVESDMTKESVMAFLQYLYEGYLMLTEENYIHVEKLARSLHIDSVISCCKDFSQSILSSSSNIQEPIDQADFKHVRITNLLKVLGSSQKRPYEYSDSDFSKRLKQSSFGNKDPSDHSSSESIASTQKPQLCPAQYQNSQGERTELRQGPCPTDQSMLYITPSNTVPMAINTQKTASSGNGVIFFSNTKFNERGSTSLNSSESLPVQTTGSMNPLNARLIIPMIPSVQHSLQTVQPSTFELTKKIPQAEPYPVFLKEVPRPIGSFSGDSSGVSAGIDKNNEQLPMVSSQNSIQQLNIHEFSGKPTEKSNSQTDTSTSNSATSTDPSAEVSLSIVKVEPEDSIIQTDEGMFLSTAQRDETQTSHSSWFHDNPSMSSEENSGQEEMSSSSMNQTTQDKPSSHRFQKLSDKEVQEIFDLDIQSKATKQNTRWGVKILQDWHTESYGVPMDMATVDEEELANKLGRFYCEAKPQPDRKKKKPAEYHKNTMKGIRAAINRHLVSLGRNIDIVNDRAFKTANKGLIGVLKQRLITYPLPPNQETIDDSDLQKMSVFLENAYLSPVHLRLAVWYVIVVHFLSKGIDFSYHLRLDSFDFKVDEEGETYACLKRERKLKNDQEGIPICEAMYDKRMYENGKRNCPVKLLKLFLDKTDSRASHLFNYCYKDAIIDPTICSLWYRDTTLKRRAFVDFLPDICKAAGCKRYTANCLRKTATRAMLIAGFKPRDVTYFSEHRYGSSIHSHNSEMSPQLQVKFYPPKTESDVRIENVDQPNHQESD